MLYANPTHRTGTATNDAPTASATPGRHKTVAEVAVLHDQLQASASTAATGALARVLGRLSVRRDATGDLKVSGVQDNKTAATATVAGATAIAPTAATTATE